MSSIGRNDQNKRRLAIKREKGKISEGDDLTYDVVHERDNAPRYAGAEELCEDPSGQDKKTNIKSPGEPAIHPFNIRVIDPVRFRSHLH